ncbi:protein fantom-like [Boleophthalmus pectinirostris]|uniref:protein fantom-like n=1 Tax=Boleophthalmus pectinirostris TaxID=150288 RepID=UPI00243197A7|nr:protein fantom-like [Boleophthalmus pectinirostris]
MNPPIPGDAQLLRDELKKKEAEFEEREKAYVFKPNVGEEEETEEFSESLHLEPGENVLELQISNVSLSPSALQSLSDPEPYTFWAYTLHLCDLHSTTFVSGRCPRYSFTSRYVVRMDQAFLDCMIQSTVTVKMYQVPGLDQTTRRLASGQIRLQPLTEQEGKIHGTVPLIGAAPCW